MSVDECRVLLGRELSVHAAHLPAAARDALLGRISYLQADVHDVDALRAVGVTEPLLVYVATPPSAVPDALRAISQAGIDRSARIVLDKPFGLSRASARALNAQILELADARDVYRIDHFLYHHVVQQLVHWRVHSDPLCIADLLRVARVEIIWDETRPAQPSPHSYPGSMRDMVQSHLLQLMAAITMDSPDSMTPSDLATNRLDALRRISVATGVDSWLVRARHGGDSSTNASSAELSEPETFVTLALRSRASRWQNVPFFLRAARGVEQSRRHIELRFAHRSHGPSLGFVRLEVLAANIVVGLAGDDASGVEFCFPVDEESPSTRLLRAALVGDDTFTLRPEEPEESWRIVEPVLQLWEETGAPMLTYPVGASAEDVAGSGTELRGT